MAKKKGNVRVITLRSEDGKSSYQTIKNSKNTPERMKLMKYNSVSRKQELHTEVKK